MKDKTDKIDSFDFMTRSGFPAVVKTIHSYETWVCGYVGVPITHPLYGISYNETSEYVKMPENEPIGKRNSIDIFCMAMRLDDRPYIVGDVFNVHGSLTYSGNLGKEDGFWYFGFDCHHCDDTYSIQNENYAKEECEQLAEQLISRVEPVVFVDNLKED